jgi:hypothetical protein
MADASYVPGSGVHAVGRVVWRSTPPTCPRLDTPSRSVAVYCESRTCDHPRFGACSARHECVVSASATASGHVMGRKRGRYRIRVLHDPVDGDFETGVTIRIHDSARRSARTSWRTSGQRAVPPRCPGGASGRARGSAAGSGQSSPLFDTEPDHTSLRRFPYTPVNAWPGRSAGAEVDPRGAHRDEACCPRPSTHAPRHRRHWPAAPQEVGRPEPAALGLPTHRRKKERVGEHGGPRPGRATRHSASSNRHSCSRP